jgi:hypothetical protein
MMTESGIMLWRHLLVGVISSKSLIECYARNLRPETWRWWLSGCPRKHLFFARRVQIAITRIATFRQKKNDNQTDNLTTKLWLSILAKMTTEQSVWLSVWRSPTVTDNQTDNQTRQQIDF